MQTIFERELKKIENIRTLEEDVNTSLKSFISGIFQTYLQENGEGIHSFKCLGNNSNSNASAISISFFIVLATFTIQ